VVDEIDIVGLPDDIVLDQLLEPGSDTVLAHEYAFFLPHKYKSESCRRCARWSNDVVDIGADDGNNDGNDMLHVDKACLTGLGQRCSGCNQLGATVLCRAEPPCNKRYHYPCAVANGCFLDAKALVMFCPDHAEEAADVDDVDATCKSCNEVGMVGDQLFCSSCDLRYHANCLQPAVMCSMSVRAGWQCPNCKTCQQCRYDRLRSSSIAFTPTICRSAGDDGRMLVCDCCDKGYHTFCMQPPLTAIPKHGWKCKVGRPLAPHPPTAPFQLCRVCSDCGARGPAGTGSNVRWHANSSICDSCHQQRNKGMCCPICSRACRHPKQQMRNCVGCRKSVFNFFLYLKYKSCV
jgi:histone-lysine N-methyltransferase MLL3